MTLSLNPCSSSSSAPSNLNAFETCLAPSWLMRLTVTQQRAELLPCTCRCQQSIVRDKSCRGREGILLHFLVFLC